MRTEKAIQRDIIKYLSEVGAWVFKVHGGPFQTAGVPDLVGVYRGTMFALEVKRPGEHLSPIQIHIIQKIKTAGGVAGRVESKEDAIDLLEEKNDVEYQHDVA